MSKKSQLPPLPEGIKSKMILARDGSPLLEMVKIPAGNFLMGSLEQDPMAYEDEKPQRKVFLNDYWIARTPVTNHMWLKFLQESGYQPPSDAPKGDYLKHWDGDKPPAGKLDHPVVNVSPMSAKWAFCKYYGLKLPSEAQWEKAARGVDGRLYPWGDHEPTADLCNFNVGDTTPVGSYQKGVSPYGLLDCAGNVWEWTTEGGYTFALRGGGFGNNHKYVPHAFRNNFFYYATNCFNFLGFRPAQDILGDKNE
jgi:formylglycine-generating enzyme required for sulfatase activity